MGRAVCWGVCSHSLPVASHLALENLPPLPLYGTTDDIICSGGAEGVMQRHVLREPG